MIGPAPSARERAPEVSEMVIVTGILSSFAADAPVARNPTLAV